MRLSGQRGDDREVKPRKPADPRASEFAATRELLRILGMSPAQAGRAAGLGPGVFERHMARLEHFPGKPDEVWAEVAERLILASRVLQTPGEGHSHNSTRPACTG